VIIDLLCSSGTRGGNSISLFYPLLEGIIIPEFLLKLIYVVIDLPE